LRHLLTPLLINVEKREFASANSTMCSPNWGRIMSSRLAQSNATGV
jgi:hypothetical protein